MKFKFRADPEDITIFVIFAIFLLYMVAQTYSQIKDTKVSEGKITIKQVDELVSENKIRSIDLSGRYIYINTTDGNRYSALNLGDGSYIEGLMDGTVQLMGDVIEEYKKEKGNSWGHKMIEKVNSGNNANEEGTVSEDSVSVNKVSENKVSGDEVRGNSVNNDE